MEPTARLQASAGWVFDAFRLDPRDARLWRGQEVLPLHPKALAVLCTLVRQAGQLVTKDEILEAVWPETAVSEAVLQVAIRELRRVLGDHARAPRLIETVHGRGYRFIAPVSPALPAVEAMRAEAPRPTPPPLFSRPAHFVGRKAELAQLARWWTMARQGRRQVAVIAGEPGIGKTALLATFVAHVAATEEVWVGHGQCVDHEGAGEPYLPVLEALGRLGRGPEGAPLVAALRRYAPSWLVQMPALLPPAEWEALQRTVGPTAPTRMPRELTEPLEAVTAERPLVLVLEDLHWSDRATLDWLASVARRPDPARLFILGTYRPVEAIVRAHPLRAVLAELRQHGQCAEVALDYLSEPEVTAYLAQRFGDTRLAADLGRTVHRRTTGNPLFLIALVDELVRQQVVQAGPEGWDVRRGGEAITATVPATLRALIEVQLARLSPADQTLLEAASVAGVEGAAAAVAAALGRAEAVVEARCASLARQGQFLQARGRAEWPDGTVTACYGFRHAVYQEVLYERIPAGRQTRWHARLGTRLAQGLGERAGDMAAALARHFVHGRLLPQAVHYLRQAGQQAAQRGAYQEAAAFYEQALSALRQLPTTPDTLAQAIDLRFDLRYVLVLLGDLGKVVQCLHEAETLAEQLHDHRRQGRVAAYLSHAFWLAGDYDRAIASGQRALRMAGDDVAVQVRARLALGYAYQNMGDYPRALACFRQATEPLTGQPICEDLGVAGLPLINIGAWEVYCLAELGAFVEGRRRGEDGVRMADAGDDREDRAAARFGLGWLHLRQGELRQAIPVLERGLSLCQEGGLPIWLAPLAAALGYAYTLAGRVSEALPLLERAVAWDTSRGVMAGHALHLAWLGEAYLRAGRMGEAVTHAGRALECSRQYKERGHEAWTLRLLGETSSHQDPPAVEPTEDHYHQAMALAEALGMRPLMAHCHHGLGTLYAKMDERVLARAELSAALDLYRAMAMTCWRPQAEAALAQLEGR